jgi:hypothetical protein
LLSLYDEDSWNPADFGFVWSLDEIKRMSHLFKEREASKNICSIIDHQRRRRENANRKQPKAAK